MTPRKQTELGARLDTLGITPEELAAILGRPLEEVEAWITGASKPDAEARILLRRFTDPAQTRAAELAAERLRTTWSRTMESDAERRADQDGWGGYRGADRTVPS